MSVEQPTFNIPSDPGTLLVLKEGLQAISDSKARAKGESTFQTEKFNELAEKTGVPNQVLRSLATVQAEGGVDKMARKVSDLEQLYHAVNRPANEIAHQANIQMAMGQDQPNKVVQEEQSAP